jgi:hypothetical protein
VSERSMSELGLDAARQLLGLTFVDLWVEYFALGGCLDANGLTAYLQHEDAVGSSDHDVIVHALNEMFTERGEDHPVAYHHV